MHPRVIDDLLDDATGRLTLAAREQNNRRAMGRYRGDIGGATAWHAAAMAAAIGLIGVQRVDAQAADPSVPPVAPTARPASPMADTAPTTLTTPPTAEPTAEPTSMPGAIVVEPIDAVAVEPTPPVATPATIDSVSEEHAPELTAQLEENPFVFHGFVSQGFMLSTGNNYLAHTRGGSFEFAEAGFNVTKYLTDDLRVGIQLFTRDLGPIGNYEAKLDWFYLDYRFADWLGVRAGRTKLPFGLYNEVNDVDAARVSVLLPQAIYPITNRDLLLAQTGAELYGYVSLGPAGALDYRLYAGTIYADTPKDKPPLHVEEFTAPYVAGGRVLWEAPLPGLRLGVSYQRLRFDTNYSLQPGAPPLFEGLARVKLPFRLWLASVEYDQHDLLLAAEYGRWSADITSNIPLLLPPDTITNERFYVMAAYRVAEWLVPGTYYSVLFPNVERRKGRENYQHDVAVTLRFDLNAHWIVKLEGHFIHGTTDLDPALNDEETLSTQQKNWTFFVAKTTAVF